MIGYALCGSFCTHKRSLAVLEQLVQEYEILPIVSECVFSTDTRFGEAQTLLDTLTYLTGKEVIHTVAQAEPIGPQIHLDLLVVSPCTGNTLAKLAHGITDTSVTMALKAQLRSDRKVLLALATNDALSANLPNIATAYSRKNVTLVPMLPDDPQKKPYSLISRFEMIPELVHQLIHS